LQDEDTQRVLGKESNTVGIPGQFAASLVPSTSRKKGRMHLYLHIDLSVCKSLDLDATQIKSKITSHLMS